MENIAKCVGAGKIDCEISLIVCDQPDAFALKRAEKLGLETFVVKRKDFASKSEFEQAIRQKLKDKKVDAIFLAGYQFAKLSTLPSRRSKWSRTTSVPTVPARD